jgi:hypothetical protein
MATKIDLSKLDSDRATLALPSGRTLRLKIEPDDIDPFADGFHGKIAHVDSGRKNDLGYRERPKGFDGNAEKLWASRSEQVWWQPPCDAPLRGTPEFDAERRMAQQLLECGATGVTLELMKGKDAYGRPIVVKVASLWGIDSLEGGYLAEVVRELAAELGLV